MQEDNAEVIGATVNERLIDLGVGSNPKHKLTAQTFPLMRGLVPYSLVLRSSWPQIFAPEPHRKRPAPPAPALSCSWSNVTDIAFRCGSRLWAILFADEIP